MWGFEAPKVKDKGGGWAEHQGLQGHFFTMSATKGLQVPQKGTKGRRLFSSLCEPHKRSFGEYPAFQVMACNRNGLHMFFFCVWLFVWFVEFAAAGAWCR